MSKRLILILAFAFLTCMAISAYAEVQNVKVSGDLLMRGISRDKIQLRKNDLDPLRTNGGYVEFGNRITGFLSHVRVRVDADLTDNVSTTVRLLNERTWGEEASSDSGASASSTDIDLDLAYITLKEFLYSPLSLIVGRQELMFGNGLIIGDPDTNGIAVGHGAARTTYGTILPKSLDDLSVRKAFDAVRAILNYDPLVVDVVYAKIDEGAIDIADDVNLYGVNANYALDKNTTVEGYYWEKRRVKAGSTTATGQQTLSDITRTLGTRVQYTGVENLLVGVEGAYQFGKHLRNTTLYPNEASNDQGARRRDAYALQLIAQYNLADLIKTYEPALAMSYTFLSGDPYKSTDKRYHGWDPMFENQAGGTLFNKILGYTNAQLLNFTASVKPMEDVKLAIDYYYLRLIKPFRSIGGPDPWSAHEPYAVNLTGVIGDPIYHMKNDKKNLGNEVDATLTYDYTEDVQIGLTAGWFIPSSAFGSENDNTASQVIGSMKVTF